VQQQCMTLWRLELPGCELSDNPLTNHDLGFCQAQPQMDLLDRVFAMLRAVPRLRRDTPPDGFGRFVDARMLFKRERGEWQVMSVRSGCIACNEACPTCIGTAGHCWSKLQDSGCCRWCEL